MEYPQYQVSINDCRKHFNRCQSTLIWRCITSKEFGLFTNYYRHRDRCNYCSPKLEQKRQHLKKEQQIFNLQELQMLYVGKRNSPI
ncbi:unnamed protein product [Rotaria sp. Silwood1]|nr:unnamed protein product [Rotaria sp. Silwood1]